MEENKNKDLIEENSKKISKQIIILIITILIFLITIYYLNLESQKIFTENKDQIYSKLCKNNESCILSISKEEKDINICNILNRSNKIEDCKTEMALYLNQSKICSNLTNKKDYCFLKYALNKNDDKKCFNILNSSKKENCYFSLSIKNKNISLCLKSPNPEKCIISNAIYYNNNKTCNLLNKTKEIEKCLNILKINNKNENSSK